MAESDKGLEEVRAAAGEVFHGQVMVEGFALIACAVEADTGERVWAIRTDPDASVFITMGLGALTRRYLAELVDGQLGYEREDED